MRHAAVIAAAGLSSRMREFKPLLCLGENTMIENVVNNLRKGGVDEIVVVTGYKSDILQKHLDPLGVRCIKNWNFAETKMYDSICLGLKSLKNPYDAVFLTPGDVPLVRPETIRAMQEAKEKIVRPVYKGKVGHPVKVCSELASQLLQYEGTNGLRGALDFLGQPILDLEVHDIGITLDADTPEDFKVLRYRKMENQSGGKLWPDIHVHIAKGDAILTPETSQFLEMIKYTGSIQSACACMHMSYSKGWKLLNQMERGLGYLLVERFPGGLSGGGSNLTPQGDRLLLAYQTYREALRNSAEQLFQEIFADELHG